MKTEMKVRRRPGEVRDAIVHVLESYDCIGVERDSRYFAMAKAAIPKLAALETGDKEIKGKRGKPSALEVA